jgi:hypothetical protein
MVLNVNGGRRAYHLRPRREHRMDRAKARAEERVLTRHPQGKEGVNISRHKYEGMKNAILESLAGKGEVALHEIH